MIKQKYKITPLFLHMLLCATIILFGILFEYFQICLSDGFISQRETKTIFEYFFVCITELLFFCLGFDVLYKYEFGNR